MLTELKRLYGQDADWKVPEQYDAVKALVDLERDVIVALRTGAGKTAVAILPSFVEDGYTVIVVPLVALMEDWVRRLDALGVKYERYLGAKKPDLDGKAKLILVSSDMAKLPNFNRAIVALDNHKPVLRYVVDEAHYYFADYTFRPGALGNPFQLRHFPAQMVLMSATIPKPAADYLIDQFVLHRPLRIASFSVREDLGIYMRAACKDLQEMIEDTQLVIEDEAKHMKENDRFLIFVTSHADGNQAAETLNLPLYYANSKAHKITDEKRQEIYHSWISGKSAGLVTTNALAAGNDYPHVRYTIHLGVPHDLVTFEQQRGRAGRDGNLASNFIIPLRYARKIDKAAIHPKYGDLRGLQAMSDLVYKSVGREHPESCLMFHASRFIDGVGKTCSDMGEDGDPCSSCAERKFSQHFFKPIHGLKNSIEGIQVASDIPAPSLPKNKSLPWTGSIATADSKRKLQEAFGNVTEQSVKRTGQLLDARFAKLKVFTDLFEIVGDVCGFCLASKVPNPTKHSMWLCPSATKEQKEIFQQVKLKVKYPEGVKGPCFRCHIASMGEDALHAQFTKGQIGCTHMDLVLPLAFAIHQIPDLHERAKAHLKPKQGWNTVAAFIQWFPSAHPEWEWQSMAILKWFSEYYLQ